MAEKPGLIKNIDFSEPLPLVNLVDYEKGRVVSRTFAQNEAVSLTLFAFDEGEGLSTHAAAGDAMVQVLDGEVSLTIGNREVFARAGEVVVMPADIPHSVNAVKRFKMILTVIKEPKK
ncbi:MAG: cupin domain-containing protein [Deltaproteobacteria bacterium]|nr:cupin domain-containing protein [Deltaproteobacteria bacterium]